MTFTGARRTAGAWMRSCTGPIVAFLLVSSSVALAAAPPDSDGDGISDATDGCVFVVDTDQRDTNGDGVGNACDPDLNDDGRVDAVDAAALERAMGTREPDADLDGDGRVTPADRAIMTEFMLQPPGPSGLVEAFVGKPPVMLDDIESLSDWVVDGTNPDVTLESDPRYVRHGAASIRMRTAAVAGNKSRITRSGLDLDLSAQAGLPDGHRLNVWMYAPTFNPDVGSQSATMAFGSDRAGFANYYSASVPSLVQGWNRIPFDRSDFSATGNPRWNLIRQIRFTVNSKEAYAIDVSFDFLEVETSTPATVLLAFDDGNAAGYTVGYAEAAPRGIPLTFYVITQNLDTPNRLTTAQVDEMYAAGNDVGLHDVDTWDHGTEQEVYDQINAQFQIVGPRWPRASHHLAFPLGEYGQRTDNVANVKAALARLGILTGRGVSRKRIQAYGGEFDEHDFLGAGVFLDENTSLAEVKDFVKTVIRTKTTAFVVGHRLADAPGNDQWKISDYIALLDWLQDRRDAGELTLSTISKWYRRTTTPVSEQESARAGD